MIWIGSLCRCGFCLKIEMIMAFFPKCGIVLVLRAVKYMLVRHLMVSSPRYFRCLIFMLSGTVELLFVLFEIANRPSVSSFCQSEDFMVYLSLNFVYLVSDVRDKFIKSFCFVPVR